jgi:single-stranded DNA-binding protein
MYTRCTVVRNSSHIQACFNFTILLFVIHFLRILGALMCLKFTEEDNFMANQQITVIGNIGGTPVFKSGEYNLCEFSVVAEEFKRGADGSLETKEGSQSWYSVTVWGGDNPESLKNLRVLQKGMRVEVTGAFKPSLYDRENGEKGINLGVSCSPSDVSLKLNRIESIQMRAKQNSQADDQGHMSEPT